MHDVVEPAVVDSSTARRGRPENRSSRRAASTSVLLCGRMTYGIRPRTTQVGLWRLLETIFVDEHIL